MHNWISLRCAQIVELHAKIDFHEKRAIPEDTFLGWPRYLDKNVFIEISDEVAVDSLIL